MDLYKIRNDTLDDLIYFNVLDRYQQFEILNMPLFN